jgi:O-antigen/teichoic acid export membrane protein
MYQPFLLLIPGILSLSGLFTLTAYFAGSDQQKINITGAVYSLIVILIGDIIFIPRYGINAAALISSIGYIVYQGYIVLVFKKEFNTSLSKFFMIQLSDFSIIKKSINASIKKSEVQENTN